MNGSANISADGLYRYGLSREWDGTGKGHLVIVMLNPSTADAELDDPTIRRCMAFAKREGFGGIMVGNLFAFRSPSPAAMKAAADPVGPENNFALTMLLQVARKAGTPVLCAWGAHGGFQRRDEWFKQRARQVNVDLVHLGLTNDGHPKHPLYIKSDQLFGVLYK